MVLNASRIILLMTSERSDVCTRSKPTYTKHMFAICAFFDLELDYSES